MLQASCQITKSHCTLVIYENCQTAIGNFNDLRLPYTKCLAVSVAESSICCFHLPFSLIYTAYAQCNPLGIYIIIGHYFQSKGLLDLKSANFLFLITSLRLILLIRSMKRLSSHATLLDFIEKSIKLHKSANAVLLNFLRYRILRLDFQHQNFFDTNFTILIIVS